MPSVRGLGPRDEPNDNIEPPVTDILKLLRLGTLSVRSIRGPPVVDEVEEDCCSGDEEEESCAGGELKVAGLARPVGRCVAWTIYREK